MMVILICQAVFRLSKLGMVGNASLFVVLVFVVSVQVSLASPYSFPKVVTCHH